MTIQDDLQNAKVEIVNEINKKSWGKPAEILIPFRPRYFKAKN